MADTPPKVKISARLVDLDTYKKYAVYVLITIVGVILIVGGVSLWRWIFPKPGTQVHKPVSVVLPGAKVEKLDQSNFQYLNEEKKWEAGVGGGGLNYDGKNGVFLGGWVKRKW